MATLMDFLTYEQQKPPAEVRLYAEGLFYKAYEQSAYYYTLGEDIKRKMINTEVLICRAHTTRDREQCLLYIDQAAEALFEIKLLLRVLHDCKQLNTKTYALMVEAVVGVEKQLHKWKDYKSRGTS